MAPDSPRRENRGSVVVAAGILVLGLAMVAGSVYVNATTTVTRAEFQEYKSGCEDLAGQSRMVDAGMGMEEVTLGESEVRRCQTIGFEEYRQDKVASMRDAPYNLRQWVLFLGIGGLLSFGGATIFRQELGARK